VIKPRYGGLLRSAGWLDYTIIFAWHINAIPEQIARAQEIGEMTFDEIDKHRTRGIDILTCPF
jgi:hypothetical protein